MGFTRPTAARTITGIWRPLVCALVLSLIGMPAFALPIYEWDATLEWDASSGADRLGIDGSTLAVSFAVTTATPTVTPDPNGTQSGYQGTGTISFGGVAVAIASSRVAFFNPSNPAENAVANFFLNPVSGDPAFFYPALILAPGANASSATAAPLYARSQIVDAFLLVPGEDALDASLNARYRMRIGNFASSDTAAAVPEPSGLVAAGLAALGLLGWGRRRGRPSRD